jgi:hypothetical protein
MKPVAPVTKYVIDLLPGGAPRQGQAYSSWVRAQRGCGLRRGLSIAADDNDNMAITMGRENRG